MPRNAVRSLTRLMDEFTVMAVLNGAIAVAYLAMAAYLTPRLGLPPAGRLAAVAFLGAGVLTHAELAYDALASEPAWLVSWHMFAVQIVQLAVVAGVLVLALRTPDL